MAALGWRRRRGSSPAARRGARQRAGLTPASAPNTLSCERETPHSAERTQPIKKSLDEDHGIFRDQLVRCRVASTSIGIALLGARATHFTLIPRLTCVLYRGGRSE